MAAAPRILFCSEHCLADIASGAAISAIETSVLLKARGWDVSVLCGDKMDGPAQPPPGETIREANGGYTGGETEADHERLAVHHLMFRSIPMRIVRAGAIASAATGDTSLQPVADSTVQPARLMPLIRLFDRALQTERPDVVIVYGGGWCGRTILKLARKQGVPSVFWLRNTSYQRKDLFDDVTGGIIVPSSFTSRHYAQSLGLRCDVLYPVVIPARVYCPVRQPKYLTFVSPLPEKGAFFFARLASEIGRRRPDIDVLIVEGRGELDWMGRTGLEVLGLPNVRTLPRTEDPRQFLAVTRLLAMPSLWEEVFGRTALEAMLSSIPVVGSARGGIPEVVGSGGVILPVPERLTRNQTLLASVAEVAPWFDAIVRLWDDDEAYRLLAREAMASAGRFDPGVIADRAEDFLRLAMGVEVASQEATLDQILLASGLPIPAAEAMAAWGGLDDSRLDKLLAD